MIFKCCFKILEFFIFILRTVSFAVVQIQLVAKLASHVTEKGTAVWIYIVSVLGGLALLALVGLALHKVGAHYSRETVRLKARGCRAEKGDVSVNLGQKIFICWVNT